MTIKPAFNNSNIRRQDRLLNEQEALDLLNTGEYGVLSMIETLKEASGGYGIPINFVWDGNCSIYFHCAPQGYKLNCLQANPDVSFCVIGQTNVIPHKFTTAYESIIVRGTASINLSEEERMHALMLLLDKYSPNDKAKGKMYTEKSLHRTSVIRLDIKEISGKTKRVKP